LSVPAYRAKKRLGQNFLKSETVINRLIELVDPIRHSTIVEIGPGRGAITLPLAVAGATIAAVEFDRDLIPYLTKLLAKYGNVRIIHDDFLKCVPDDFGREPFYLVGNLPYNITSPVVEWICRHRSRLLGACLMVQKEVALRLTATPPGKDWSPLSIFTQLYFAAEYCFQVAPSGFTPQPQVSSAVLRLVPAAARDIPHPCAFEAVVRQAFERRRKTLVNNLVPDIIPDSSAAVSLIGRLGWPANTRAEQLTTEQFLELTDSLVTNGFLGKD
jgi:16S rRNA (adenine1518-N6/adenine1519-N6)-dimethyltransferase